MKIRKILFSIIFGVVLLSASFFVVVAKGQTKTDMANVSVESVDIIDTEKPKYEEDENELNEFIGHLNGISDEIAQRRELRQHPDELEEDYLNNVINLLIDSDVAADYDELIEAFKAYKGGVLVYLYGLEY